MNDWIKRSVAGTCAVIGGWLCAMGVITPEDWAGAVDEGTVLALSGIVTVVVYGMVNFFTQKMMNIFKGEETVIAQVDVATGETKAEKVI